MKNKKKELILAILALLSLTVMTLGVTYSLFIYSKKGTTENTITSEAIKFIYNEKENQVGNGINIENALPMSDELGKSQTGNGNVFNFKIASTTASKMSIPYQITLKKDSSSTLDEKVVKVYLAEVNGMVEEEVVLGNFSVAEGEIKKLGLTNYKTDEKILYTGKVPSNQPNYEQNFVLKMWIDEDTEFSVIIDGDGHEEYPLSGKTFKARVNVYANEKVLTEEDKTNESNAEIKNIYLGSKEDNNPFEKVEGQEYQYEISVPINRRTAIVEVETESEDAKVKIERIDNLSLNNIITVERISTKKILNLVEGDNYFKVTVTPLVGNQKTETIIKIVVGESVVFDYESDEVQSYEIPESGMYKLEVWGAQGTSKTDTENGGYGAYATGEVYLARGQNVHVYVGSTAGYNGGGVKTTYSYGTGGGATHIAVDKKLGELQNYSNNKDSLLIVAAGGGSGAAYFADMPGGAGGGHIGGSPYYNRYNVKQSYFANSPGTTADSDFGKGKAASGGGYLGGYYYSGSDIIYSGSGGSSYIGNSDLENKVMYMYCESSCDSFKSTATDTKTEVTTNVSRTAEPNSAKKGNGYAKITYLGSNPGYDIKVTSIYANDVKAEEYENKSYKYKVILAKDTTSATLRINRKGISAPMIVKDSNNNVVDINNPVSLNARSNIFEVKITSEDNTKTNKFKINIYVLEEDPVIFNYSSTGEQTFPITKSGTYKLEVWGAQGGSYNDTYRGGYGGYSSGEINLTSGQTLFINVGGAGTGGGTSVKKGGYNGGGDTNSTTNASIIKSSGGGATHIALSSGELKTFGLSDKSGPDPAKKDNILIVAGGGGGFGWPTTITNYQLYKKFGEGGGFMGGVATFTYKNASGTQNVVIESGSQSSAGRYVRNTTIIETGFGGSFGVGGIGGYSGGGGGYFGGAGSGAYSSSGGSGYIGNEGMTNGIMYMYCVDDSYTDCNDYRSSAASTKTEITTSTTAAIPAEANKARIGNGYARVTYIED